MGERLHLDTALPLARTYVAQGLIVDPEVVRPLLAALDDADTALPDFVSGDAAPQGATLADRIRALESRRAFYRRGWETSHERYTALRRAARAAFDTAAGDDAQLVAWRELRELLDLPAIDTPSGETP